MPLEVGSVTATPLATPFTSAVSAAAESADGAAAAAESVAEAAELKKKVARLKKLLAAANSHIEKMQAGTAVK